MIENTNAIDSLTKEIKHHLENITQVTDQRCAMIHNL